MPSLTEIEVLTKRYADAHTVLCDHVAALNAELEAIKRARLRCLKIAVNAAAEHKAALSAAIQDSPDLFVKPRTVVCHGVRVGYQKGKGVLNWDDPDTVVDRIERLFKDQADVLITTTKVPNKTALLALTAGELKRLGCTVTGDGDAVVIRPTDSEVDRIVAALLKDAEAEAVAERP